MVKVLIVTEIFDVVRKEWPSGRFFLISGNLVHKKGFTRNKIHLIMDVY